MRKPDRYKNIDTGDITAQLEVKERLKCKPFSYFLEVVAPDMLEKYPPTQTEFASGVVSIIVLIISKGFSHKRKCLLKIESIAFPNKCIDSRGQFYKEMGIYFCGSNKRNPGGHQHFLFGHHRDLEYYSDSAYCIDTRGDKLELHACHHQQGTQYFRYDLDTQQMKTGPSENKCLEADETNGSEPS